MKNIFLSVSILMSVFHVAVARAGHGEMKGFRFQQCESSSCVVVEAPKAWLSQSNGAFVASGEDKAAKDAAKLQLIENGKVTREFRGDEIVSQPEIHTMTVESVRDVILVDIEKGSFEVIPKTATIPQHIERGSR